MFFNHWIYHCIYNLSLLWSYTSFISFDYGNTLCTHTLFCWGHIYMGFKNLLYFAHFFIVLYIKTLYFLSLVYIKVLRCFMFKLSCKIEILSFRKNIVLRLEYNLKKIFKIILLIIIYRLYR